MRIPYHDIGDRDFERLVVAICAEILGDGVQPFSTGPDGGRDARFQGTAARFPSENSPFSGKFVAQAKHTEHPYAKFSDPDFCGTSQSAVLTEELPRISRLVSEGELEHYLLFSNRRLAGVADADIRSRIRDQSGARSVELFGLERIDLLLKRYPSIERVAGIAPFSGPLIITPGDLAEVILSLDRDKRVFAEASKPKPVDQLRRTSFDAKNTVNGLTEGFAREILSTYLKDFRAVKRFLALPSNKRVLERYMDAAAELHEQILAHRADYDTFDKVLVRIQRLLWDRDHDLAQKKRLTKLVLYYMYWNCDVGETVDARTG